MKKLKRGIVLVALLFTGLESFSQQWAGSSTISGNINRNGNVSIGTTDAGACLRLDMDVSGTTYPGIWLERNNNIYVDTHARLSISANGGIPGLVLSVSSDNGANFQPGIFITEYANVGIGTGTPSQKLQVSGNVLANSYLTSSDGRFKKNVEAIGNEQSKLFSIRGVSYEMNKESFKDYEFNDRKHIGLIAQEVREVFPELVYEDSNGYLSVDYVSFIPIIIEVLKNQSNTIKDQENKISRLENLLLNSDDSAIDEISASASLQQNFPNPFNSSTEIGYSIPENSVESNIFVYDMNGRQLKSYNLKEKGNNSISIGASELEAGLYIYTLIIDGIEISSKRLILTK
jgi:hypothetical protein